MNLPGAADSRKSAKICIVFLELKKTVNRLRTQAKNCGMMVVGRVTLVLQTVLLKPVFLTVTSLFLEAMRTERSHDRSALNQAGGQLQQTVAWRRVRIFVFLSLVLVYSLFASLQCSCRR